MDNRQVGFPTLLRTKNVIGRRDVTGPALDNAKDAIGALRWNAYGTQGARFDDAPNDTTSNLEALFAQFQRNMMSSITTNGGILPKAKRFQERYDLQEFICDHNFDIALLAETKLSTKHIPVSNDYTIIRMDRPICNPSKERYQLHTHLIPQILYK
ncbi:hypothetical protein M0802_009624 [Mischocyttarus mexicanus]|nr:hypothetical protein M0802_009624 [Mischocyttarus mexicanus]